MFLFQSHLPSVRQRRIKGSRGRLRGRHQRGCSLAEVAAARADARSSGWPLPVSPQQGCPHASEGHGGTGFNCKLTGLGDLPTLCTYLPVQVHESCPPSTQQLMGCLGGPDISPDSMKPVTFILHPKCRERSLITGNQPPPFF